MVVAAAWRFICLASRSSSGRLCINCFSHSSACTVPNMVSINHFEGTLKKLTAAKSALTSQSQLLLPCGLTWMCSLCLAMTALYRALRCCSSLSLAACNAHGAHVCSEWVKLCNLPAESCLELTHLTPCQEAADMALYPLSCMLLLLVALLCEVPPVVRLNSRATATRTSSSCCCCGTLPGLQGVGLGGGAVRCVHTWMIKAACVCLSSIAGCFSTSHTVSPQP